MTWNPKSLGGIPWLAIGLLGIFLVSLALRFWQLSRFNTLVFDEVYYANFAAGYLRGEQQFGGHPPISTYIHALGIWISERLGWGDQTLRNSLTRSDLATFSYRWTNALFGAFFPLVIGAIAFQLTRRKDYTFIAALFAAVDGMFLVESRYALNNIYLVLFGLLGHLFLLLALRAVSLRHQREGGHFGAIALHLTLMGLFFGASIGIKWNGAAFLLGAGAMWAIAWGVKLLNRWRKTPDAEPGTAASPLEFFPRLNLGWVIYGFALIPAITYYLSWIPYMQLKPGVSFWEWQGRVLDYHSRVAGASAHPYCSPWYSWPLMVRPVAYFYKTSDSPLDPTLNPSPVPTSGNVIFDVHAMGNPFLWWFAAIAILLFAVTLLFRAWDWLQKSPPEDPLQDFTLLPHRPSATWTATFFVVNWLTNWLPWIKVSRCIFIYHYMGAFTFSLLAIALIVSNWLRSPQRPYRAVAITTIFLVIAAFVFWMPFYLGLPLSSMEVTIRRWFPSWI